MTWNTSGGAVKRKKDSNHCHNRKRFTIKSRRPSFRHRVVLDRSRHYSANTDVRKKPSETDEVLDKHESYARNDTSGTPTPVTTGWSSQTKSKVHERERSAQYATDPAIDSRNPVPNRSLSESESNDSTLRGSNRKMKIEQSSHISHRRFPRKNQHTAISTPSPSAPPPQCLRDRVPAGANEDLGPEISVIRDPHWTADVRKTWKEDLGPQISIVEDLYGPREIQLRDSRENQVQHFVVDTEVNQNENEGSKDGSRIWHILKVRRRGSRRNRSKFTLRRKQSEVDETEKLHSQEQADGLPRKQPNEDVVKELCSQEQAGSFTRKQSKEDIAEELCSQKQVTRMPTQQDGFEEEPISTQDIEIEFKDHLSEDPTVLPDESLLTRMATPPAVMANAIHDCTEAESLEHEGLPVSIPRQRTRRHRTRKIQVRMRRRPRKILVIGDMCSGKTNLISAYIRDRFTAAYTPTILHCYLTDARVWNESIELVVIEISGRDDFEPLRRRAYHKIDGAVICYSVDSAPCFDRIREFWVPELRKHAPKVPFLLVGTKRDLKDDARDRLEEVLCLAMGEDRDSNRSARLRAEVGFNEKFVSEDRGKRMAKNVGAECFIECSSLYRDRTRDVFETVTKVAMRKTRRERRRDNRHLDSMCTIL